MSDAPFPAHEDDTWQVRHAHPWLVARFGAAQRVASWAIVGGGLRSAHVVAWLSVRNADLPCDRDPQAYLAAQLAQAGLHGAVGLLTSRDLGAYVVRGAQHAGVAARCVATVGLGNALRAGDAPSAGEPAGTINVLCHVSAPLSELASLEALALAAEARTCALLEAGVASRASGQPATGTGTDCIVIASPLALSADEHAYAGKHTAAGHVIGAAVHAAVCEGVAGWIAQYGAGRLVSA